MYSPLTQNSFYQFAFEFSFISFIKNYCIIYHMLLNFNYFDLTYLIAYNPSYFINLYILINSNFNFNFTFLLAFIIIIVKFHYFFSLCWIFITRRIFNFKYLWWV